MSCKFTALCFFFPSTKHFLKTETVFSQRQKGTKLPLQLKSLLRTQMGPSVWSTQNGLSMIRSTANLLLLTDLKARIIRLLVRKQAAEI